MQIESELWSKKDDGVREEKGGERWREVHMTLDKCEKVIWKPTIL